MTSEHHEEEIDLPTELGKLATYIETKPESFATGDADIRDAALLAAKYMFDLALKSESRALPHLKELLQSIKPEEAPRTRARTYSAGNTGRKGSHSTNAILNETPLPSMVVDGMDDEQVWAQLELKAGNVCQTLEDTFDAGDMDARGIRGMSDSEDSEEEDVSDSDELRELESLEGLNEEGLHSDDPDDGEDEEETEDEDKSVGGDVDASSDEEGLGETTVELRDEPSADSSDDERFMDLDALPSPRRIHARKNNRNKHAELDSGFFSLADFNAEIEEAEAKSVSRGSLSKGSDDDESADDNELDYFAFVDDKAVLEGSEDDNGKDAYYEDFFDASPNSVGPRKRKTSNSSSKPRRSSKVRFDEQVKVKKIKSKGKGRPLSSVDLRTGEDILEDDEQSDSSSEGPDLDDEEYHAVDSDEESDSNHESHWESIADGIDQGREAVERLKDDLFAGDDDQDASQQLGLSAHEARMETIRKQIAELEAENVGEKDWVLKGEVSSRARPQNALLEEDLEFEHVSKAIPVVTDETVHDLEARIKARIVEGHFDDVVRKRPVEDKPFLPSRMFELQDTKSKESLAQIYENEFMATKSGNMADDRDSRLQKEYEEIEKQWESICYKLDALCNAHFTPKQPKATISTVPNVSAVILESPLPTAKAAATVLTPEEVFAPNTSDLRSKSELTPPEKQALRLKERKRRKKQRELLDKSVDKFAKSKGAKSVKKQKEEALKSVVKTGKGVTVIGKKAQGKKESKRVNS